MVTGLIVGGKAYDEKPYLVSIEKEKRIVEQKDLKKKEIESLKDSISYTENRIKKMQTNQNTIVSRLLNEDRSRIDSKLIEQELKNLFV